MQQFALNFMPKHPQETVYALTCRSGDDLTVVKESISEEINKFMQLKFKEDELIYLSSLGYFKDNYINYLRELSFKNCKVNVEEIDGKLSLRIHGPWKETILFEVPCLAIIQEVFFLHRYNNKNKINEVLSDGRKKLKSKINLIKSSDINFADFGSRRRFSFEWHKEVVKTLQEHVPTHLSGTSNVLLAKELNLTPIGTMAHQFFSAMQGLEFLPIELSQKYALHQWHKEYEGKLDTALTDIFNIDSFIHDCDYELLKKYSGYRHDSGCPYYWGDRLIKNFLNYGINPKDKKLVFSDGLNIPKAIEINKHFKNKINVLFGIGTNLTNDFDSHSAMSLVIKLVNYNELPVIKVSDEPAKLTCESEELKEYVLNYLNDLKTKEHTYPIINTCVDVVIRKDDKFLMIKRGDSSEAEFNKLAFAGGFVDINETAIEAAKREVNEEIGLNINSSKLNFLEYRDSINRDPRKRTISLIFTYEITDEELSELKINTKEVLNTTWITKVELDNYIFAFDHKEIIEGI